MVPLHLPRFPTSKIILYTDMILLSPRWQVVHHWNQYLKGLRRPSAPDTRFGLWVSILPQLSRLKLNRFRQHQTAPMAGPQTITKQIGYCRSCTTFKRKAARLRLTNTRVTGSVLMKTSSYLELFTVRDSWTSCG